MVLLTVAQFHDSLAENVDVVIELNRSVLENILLGEVEGVAKDGVHPNTPQSALMAHLESADVRLARGTPEDFESFFSYFDPVSREPIPLTIR